MKKITLLFTLLFLALSGFSQTNYYRYSVGGGGGGAVAFADVGYKKITFVGYGGLEYYATPFVSFGLEVQKGQFAGGDLFKDRYHREFVNDFLSATVNVKVQLGEFLTRYDLQNVFLNTVRGSYLGVGLGVIKNDVSNIRSWNGTTYPGADRSDEMVIPLNAGINFYIPNEWGYHRFVINMNLQHTITLGEGLDGYGVRGFGSSSEHNDVYWYGSIGLKYNFGPMGLDRRR